MKNIIFFFSFQFMLVNLGFAQTKREIQQWTQEYTRMAKPEITLEGFIQSKQRAAANQRSLESGKSKSYGSRAATVIDSDVLCSVGGFENLNSLSQYFNGGYADYPSIPLDYNTFIQGFSTIADITSAASRQTIVSNMDDPTINETLNTARTGNSALRLGNRINGHGVEFISVDINVSSPLISFWYAMVLHNPDTTHTDAERPFFKVRVLDENGNEINNVVNLGGNSNMIQSNDPFVFPATVENGVNVPAPQLIRYKPWSCAQIDLSDDHIGENVTIQFINSDCSLGGHMSYTYIDDISCAGCAGDNPTGSITFNNTDSDCLSNKICFDYNLPDNGVNTGEINISLVVKGMNNVTQTYNSGTLNSGNSFCFILPVADVINFGGSYDFVAVAEFSLNGQNVNTLNSGAWPDGHIAGSYNDCFNPLPDYDLSICCPPINPSLMMDLFEHVPSGPITGPFQLNFNNSPYFKNLFQGYLDYMVAMDPSIDKLASHWRLIDAGNGPTPNDVWTPMIAETFTWFEPGQGGNIFGNSIFFTPQLNINHWYKIYTGIFTEPAPNIFKECNTSSFFLRFQIMNGRLTGTLTDGKRKTKTIYLGKID